MSLDQRDEMTAAAIARLAGVGRAAVSNWRRRYPEFPRPVGGTPSSPTFSRVDVEEWLRTTGKADQLSTAGRTDTGTQLIAGRSEVVSRQLDGERAVADLTSSQLLARVMVSLLPPSTTTEGPVDTEEPVVLDPACSEGARLTAVADRFGDQIRLAGQALDESAAGLAALNLRDHPHQVRYEIHAGDPLRDDRLAGLRRSVAGVVCAPPPEARWPADELATDSRWVFGTPGLRDGELAWVQHCYAYLRPRGVAVVAVSARACVQASGAKVRTQLVRSGALREVIALPTGLASDAGLCLWVLQRPLGGPDLAAVRMADLSALGDPADVPRESPGWRQLFEGADASMFRAVPRVELLDAETNLLPSRHLAAGAEVSAADLARVTDRLRALYARVGQGLRAPCPPDAPPRHSYVTVGELERVGALTIRGRDTTPRAGDLLLRTLGRRPVVATGTDADDAGVAQVVEVEPTRLDAHYVATFLRADAQAVPLTNTLGALSRDDLRRCRIPRMPLAEQRRYGAEFRHLEELRGALSALARASATVIEQTIHGLTTGTLAPASTPIETEGEQL